MKKIIAAFDGLKFSESTQSYAIQLAKQCSAHLVGVFLEDPSYTSYRIYDLVTAKGKSTSSIRRKWNKKDTKLRATAVSNFESACTKEKVHFTVHRDRHVAIQELLHESIYADLVVIDSRESLTHYPEKAPTEFIRNLLSSVQCPVLVVPHVYKPISKLVLLYDGEPSSVYAIKMFSYTLPALKPLTTEVITVNEPKKNLPLPDARLMKEFMQRHFPKTSYTGLKGVAELQITSYLKNQKELPLVVLGAYRRGVVSRWFRVSMADVLMKDLKVPLFIAHNK